MTDFPEKTSFEGSTMTPTPSRGGAYIYDEAQGRPILESPPEPLESGSTPDTPLFDSEEEDPPK